MTPLHNYDLSFSNTMALRCTADVAIILDTPADIAVALNYAKSINLPILVISGGSNVLLPTHLHACVLLPRFTGISILNETADSVCIQVAGGENWHNFVQQCLSHGWYGLENLALIPGMVGACPVQNIGAYGVQVSDFITKVLAYDLIDGSQRIFGVDECDFAYRDSFFKRNPNRYLISHVVFKLHKNQHQVLTSYGDLAGIAQDFAQDNNRSAPTPNDVYHAVVQIRQSKLPDPAVLPNCGSFFQNPIITLEQFNILKIKYPQLPSYPIDNKVIKIPAGWLIDEAGLKGKGIAPIFTHTQQALVLTNHATHHATQDDIRIAQEYIMQIIYDKFGVWLIREPVWIHANGSTSL